MDAILELKKQIEKVILLLEQRLIDDPDRPILKTLYDRYVKAGEILTNNDNIEKIMIVGGCRAYLDAFSDYMNPCNDVFIILLCIKTRKCTIWKCYMMKFLIQCIIFSMQEKQWATCQQYQSKEEGVMKKS